MDLQLRGRSVLVTGGSRGIGLAIAAAFAREGANVAICGRNARQLEIAAREVGVAGGDCLPISADLSDPVACARVVDATATRFERLDVLINNASTNVDNTPRSFEEATDAQLLERVHGKVLAAMRCSRAALPHMRKTGGGRIIFIGGLSARFVAREEAMSSSSGLPQGLGNSMVSNFAKYLAEEVAAAQITVNIVHPFFTQTERHSARVAAYAQAQGICEADAQAAFARKFPIGRMVTPADIAPMVVLLGSPLSGATTGQAIAIDGGVSRNIMY